MLQGAAVAAHKLVAAKKTNDTNAFAAAAEEMCDLMDNYGQA